MSKNRVRIIHMSDFHIGNDYLINMLRKRRWFRVKVNKILQEGIRTAISSINPHYLVISGDFVNKPNPASFRSASQYLAKVLEGTSFASGAQLLVVPGNHDIRLGRKEPDDHERLERYKRFLQDIFPNGANYRQVISFPKDRVLFACLDSTLKTAWGIAEGEIGDSQISWLKSEVQRISGDVPDLDEYVKIAVVHHHCVSITGLPAKTETAMSLLDSGELLEALESLGFCMVLHGHKHFPHMKVIRQEDSRILTVIGAGSVACSFADEQNETGHNFNLIELDLEANSFTRQLYRANAKGTFVADNKAEQLPLYSQEPAGYRIRKVRKSVIIGDTLKRTIHIRQYGIRIEKRGTKISSLPVEVTTEVGEITRFHCTSDNVELFPRRNDPDFVSLDAHLKIPLEFGKGEVDIGYEYVIEGGTAICALDYLKLNPNEKTPEDCTQVTVAHPMEKLEIEVLFPQEFRPQCEVRIDHLGTIEAVPKAVKQKFDPILGIHSVSWKNPRIGSRIGIYWKLP